MPIFVQALKESWKGLIAWAVALIAIMTLYLSFYSTMDAGEGMQIFIDQLRIYASMDDWFTFTKYPGFDPEIIGAGASMGVDKGNYPTSKKVVFGVNISF